MAKYLIIGRARSLSTATLYIKGFLNERDPSDSKEAKKPFRPFHNQHIKLRRRGIWLPDDVYGYPWKSGCLSVISRSIMKGLIGGFAAGFFSSVFGWLFGSGLVVSRLVEAYERVKKEAIDEAPGLAAEIKELSSRYENVRVVAHSLGCLLAVRAAASLPRRDRPSQLILLAPAMCEDDEKDILGKSSRDRTWLCHTKKDLILGWFFPFVSDGKKALGEVGPQRYYPGLTAVDVCENFDFGHLEYEDHFADLVKETSLSLPTRQGMLKKEEIKGPIYPAGWREALDRERLQAERQKKTRRANIERPARLRIRRQHYPAGWREALDRERLQAERQKKTRRANIERPARLRIHRQHYPAGWREALDRE